MYTLVMVQQGNDVLLLDRPQSKQYPGYIAPGGKIDFPESPLDGAIREVREETGLHVEKIRYKGLDEYVVPEEGFRYMVYNFLAYETSGDLLEHPPEGSLVWVPKTEALKLPMQPFFKRKFPLFFEEGTFEIHTSWNGKDKDSADVTIRILS
ncbi:8-oxo-dGTP diphosphatase (plasmid) [Cytobacillus spongiae]|uniref:NUDIX domain-containing protein n=1 Tax=Cytobacillus spongiae TaxID=2901381 RepID=UPI00145FAA39|nr:8-oxo-dGTP diphosphatase [Cytobacillus spongiae]MCA1062526.1 8-oxo-dGTP diphosphatase [Rossellomorea aquimaris]NMH71030.1 8-oxo-dGTP diphosphatase [Bacillus sp. RO3]UII58681.1 8-oxo-dGTP diphosphatase [Cytobacillus spongiae]WJV31619.1 8-oxo-dGTP diphosphatase [Rossellomorea sp. AcN35-11]